MGQLKIFLVQLVNCKIFQLNGLLHKTCQLQQEILFFAAQYLFEEISPFKKTQAGYHFAPSQWVQRNLGGKGGGGGGGEDSGGVGMDLGFDFERKVFHRDFVHDLFQICFFFNFDFISHFAFEYVFYFILIS